MLEQDELRRKIRFRLSPLQDLALSVLVVQNPERFGPTAWADRVEARLKPETLIRIRELGEQVDLFAIAAELEAGPPRTVPDALRSLVGAEPALSDLLLAYWEAISPEVGATAGLLAESIRREEAALDSMDPGAYIARFSDRVSLAGDGDSLILHWGKGMRIPLRDLDRIQFIPSAFCPRRLMFYRLGPTQIFFYDPTRELAPAQVAEAPESLVLGFSALGDMTRLKLLRLIATESLPAQEMARRLEVNESTISRHLRLMVEAGLVNRERQEGKYVLYGFQRERIDQLAALVGAYLRGERE